MDVSGCDNGLPALAEPAGEWARIRSTQRCAGSTRGLPSLAADSTERNTAAEVFQAWWNDNVNCDLELLFDLVLLCRY
jgi:hypothetical protein